MKEIEILLRKLLLKIFLLFNPIKKNMGKIELTENSKALLIRLNRVGDALVTTPFIRKLKTFSNCNISILADKKNSFVFENNPNITEVIQFEKGFSATKKIIKKLNKKNFDVVIDLHDDTSTTVSFLISLLKIKHKLGFKKESSNLYTNKVVRPNPKTTHIIDRLDALFTETNIPQKNDFNIEYNYDKKAQSFAENLIKENFNNSKMLLGINITAGSKARFWGIENFKQLIKDLQKYDINILLIVLPEFVELAKNIAEDKIKILSTTSFQELAAVISKLNLLFTPDTSIIHLASAYKIPTFGLYVKYKTEDVIWYPYKAEYDVIITEETDFKNIAYQEVIEKFEPFLERFYGT